MSEANPKVQKAIKIAGLALLFVFSFLFFLYMTFPYGVLKERITGEISKATGFDVTVGSLGPRLPLGFSAKDVRIAPRSGGSALKFDRLLVNISVFNLLIGRLGVETQIVAENNGTLSLWTRQGLVRMLSHGAGLPSVVVVDAVKFPLNQIVDFALGTLANGPDANPLIAPMLSKLSFQGQFNGNVNLDLNEDNPADSSGVVDVKINDGRFLLNDTSLNIAEQKFNKAQLKATMAQGTLKLDDSSGIQSQELDVLVRGKVQFKDTLPRSLMDMTVGVKLDKGLKENFGFILSAASGGTGGQDGRATWQLLGPVTAPSVKPM